MADDQVDLTPEDIPGARFSEEEKGKFTFAHLKFWLKCSRINQNGNLKKTLFRLLDPASRDRSAVMLFTFNYKLK